MNLVAANLIQYIIVVLPHMHGYYTMYTRPLHALHICRARVTYAPVYTPQVFKNQHYGRSSEIYSWAIIMWVLASHGRPFEGACLACSLYNQSSCFLPY